MVSYNLFTIEEPFSQKRCSLCSINDGGRVSRYLKEKIEMKRKQKAGRISPIFDELDNGFHVFHCTSYIVYWPS